MHVHIVITSDNQQNWYIYTTLSTAEFQNYVSIPLAVFGTFHNARKSSKLLYQMTLNFIHCKIQISTCWSNNSALYDEKLDIIEYWWVVIYIHSHTIVLRQIYVIIYFKGQQMIKRNMWHRSINLCKTSCHNVA